MKTNDILDEHLKKLVEKYIANNCSKEELNELMLLVNNKNDELKIEEIGIGQWENDKVIDTAQADKWNAKFETLIELAKEPSVAPVIPLYTKKISAWWRIAIAAVIILAGGSYFLLSPNNNLSQGGKEAALAKDVEAPKLSRAIITLANGKTIALDSVTSGTLSKQGNVKVMKLADGQIAYNPDAGDNAEVMYNTLSNPRGSKVINLTLSDGTNVWLNAESSLRYPTAFTGKDRNVELTGEAYFEVTHNAAKPFRVKKEDAEIIVLGTHFNINSYNDEVSLKTTLLEGSVKVHKGNESLILTPGQQAQVINSGKIVLNKDVDVNEVLAWKDGFFEFENMELPAIMRQVERWYDVSVVYKNINNTERFGGRINKNLSLTAVLKLLETNGVHFKLEGKKITVL